MSDDISRNLAVDHIAQVVRDLRSYADRLAKPAKQSSNAALTPYRNRLKKAAAHVRKAADEIASLAQDAAGETDGFHSLRFALAPLHSHCVPMPEGVSMPGQYDRLRELASKVLIHDAELDQHRVTTRYPGHAAAEWQASILHESYRHLNVSAGLLMRLEGDDGDGLDWSDFCGPRFLQRALNYVQTQSSELLSQTQSVVDFEYSEAMEADAMARHPEPAP